MNPDVRNVKDDQDWFQGHYLMRAWKKLEVYLERADVGFDLMAIVRMCQNLPHGWVYIVLPNQK